MDNFDPYNVLLSIATNIPVLLMTASVLQEHIWSFQLYFMVVIVECETLLSLWTELLRNEVCCSVNVFAGVCGSNAFIWWPHAAPDRRPEMCFLLSSHQLHLLQVSLESENEL